MKKLIEEYIFNDIGYSPYLITEGWQVAKLNWMPTHGFYDMIDFEAHYATDEAFVLLDGTAILVCGEKKDDGYSFELTQMKPFITYNIPKGVLHNIGMSNDAQVLIVEKDNTHNNDVTHFPFNEEQKMELSGRVEEFLRLKE